VLRGNGTGRASLPALFPDKLPAISFVPMQADQQVMRLSGIVRLRQHDYVPLLSLVMRCDERNVAGLAGTSDRNEPPPQHASHYAF
jgi:hypothetical protein